MNKKLTPMLVLALMVSLTACATEQAPPTGGSDVAVLRGTYASTGDGKIDAIAFEGDTQYMILGSGCRSQACAELGTYAWERARNMLILTRNDGLRRELSVEVLSTTGKAKASPALTPRSLTDGAEQLVKGQSELVAPVDRALVDGEPVELLAANPCHSNIPTGYNVAKDAAWWAMCPNGVLS